MRSCEEYELLASLAVDEEATLEEQAELTKHLESCPACRAYFEDIRRIHEVLSPRDVAVPEGFAARVMFRVRETAQDRPEEQKKKVISFPHWKRWTALAACCAVAALSVWAAGSFGGGKEDAVSMDDMQRTAAQDARSVPEMSDAQDMDESSGEEELVLMRSEDLPSLPEERKGEDAAACKESDAAGVYQLPENGEATLEPDVTADTMPEYTAAGGEETDILPAAVSGGQEQMDESEPADAPDRENAAEPAESEWEAGLSAAPVPAAPEEPDEVAPAEVIGAPEPGILIAYGGAAQEWVENVLGLEWAVGGSYSLTAEQYGDLIRTLDQAGEPYSIEPGDEGYCLMTE